MNIPAPPIAALSLALVIAACFGGDLPQQDSVATLAAVKDWRGGKSRQHMHEHAEQLETLTAALEAGDLDAAMTPAYWLSIHHSIDGLPDDLKPYVADMRTAATAVEQAQEIDAARAAASRILGACDACHSASRGVAE